MLIIVYATSKNILPTAWHEGLLSKLCSKASSKV